jgi:monoamine oxidase
MRCLTLEKGAWEVEAEAAWEPMRRELWEKATTAGDSHLDSALRSTSMPRCRAAAATRVSLSTLIVADPGIRLEGMGAGQSDLGA